MFNLLVSYSGWTPPRGDIPKGRFLTQTDDHILEIVCPNEEPNWEMLKNINTLFMPEIDSRAADPFGRVGKIQNITDTGKAYRLNFYFDQSIPPIPIADIESMAQEFGVYGFGLANTHWSVKDSDLYEMLFKRFMPIIPEGHAFTVERLPVRNHQIALMMPFENKFNNVRDAIVGLANSIGCDCLRADNVWTEDVIIQDVINLIIQSKLVICDVTGRNPNVFYEAGISHALGKRVILITQRAEDVPFDLRHLRYVTYLNNKQGLSELCYTLRDRVVELINE